MLTWLIAIICVIVGFIVGVLVSSAGAVALTFGTIKSMDSEDGPYLYLDLDKRPEEMAKHSFVVFKVGMKRDAPHK